MAEYHDESQLGTLRVMLLFGFLGVTVMLYNLTVSVYDNYQIQAHIEDFKERNEALKLENQEKLDELQYVSSEEYREKMAKEELGLVHSGEKVIVIPTEELVIHSDDAELEGLQEELIAGWSNPKKWWNFFFNLNPFKS